MQSTGLPVVLSSDSPDKTYRWGMMLGALLDGGDAVALVGELGAGKTTFTQGIVRGLGVPEHHYIGSPTFTLISEYEGRVPVYHLDFYRIDGIAEAASLGLEEYFEGDGVAIIEWADKIEALLPKERITVRLAHADCHVRTLQIMGTGEHCVTVVTSLAGKVSQASRSPTGCMP